MRRVLALCASFCARTSANFRKILTDLDPMVESPLGWCTCACDCMHTRTHTHTFVDISQDTSLCKSCLFVIHRYIIMPVMYFCHLNTEAISASYALCLMHRNMPVMYFCHLRGRGRKRERGRAREVCLGLFSLLIRMYITYGYMSDI
jgi:hypothetical protein